jgi:hypothetical protein
VTGTSAVGAAKGYDVKELTSIFNETVGDIVTTMVNNGYFQSQENLRMYPVFCVNRLSIFHYFFFSYIFWHFPVGHTGNFV